MDKYCTNCGHELMSGADYCLGCGRRITGNYQRKEIRKNQNFSGTLEIIGMILGIISFFVIFTFDLGLGDAINSLSDEWLFTRLFVAIFWSSLAFIPAFIGFIISLISIRREKTIYGVIGIITSIVSFTFAVLTIIYLIK